MEGLIRTNSVSSEAAEFLAKLVRAKYNVFISGGTGSGKTTFLNALSYFIPIHERVVTIEDSAELQLQGLANQRQWGGLPRNHDEGTDQVVAEDAAGPDHRGGGQGSGGL